MNVLDAAYHVVHDYPGGAASLAPRLGKSPTTLCHEVSGTGSAKLGLVDACKVTQFTQNIGILQAFAESCGHMVVALPEIPALASSNVMLALAESSREFSDLCREVCSGMSDDVISDNELARIESARSHLLAQLAHLGEAIHTLNLAGKPRHERI